MSELVAKKIVVSVSIDPEVDRQMRIKAKRLRLSLSAAVQRACAEWAGEQKPEELFPQRGPLDDLWFQR